MGIGEVISCIEQDIFGRYMNLPEPPLNTAYISYNKDNEPFVTCPICGKKQFRIQENTKITNLVITCNNSKCKHEIPVEIE